MAYPNDAAVVQNAIRQARNVGVGDSRRKQGGSMYGLGVNAVTSTPDPDSNNPGGSIINDGAGNIATTDANGVLLHFAPALSNKVAWMQTPVYVAAGVGILLGAAGYYAYSKRKKR